MIALPALAGAALLLCGRRADPVAALVAIAAAAGATGVAVRNAVGR
ncbi:hypothetical protein [Nocardia abscessus]|nr:hypothetical protein [Nocardia abscessus]